MQDSRLSKQILHLARIKIAWLYASIGVTVICVKPSSNKNFRLGEPAMLLLRRITEGYGKKADGMAVTAGLLRLAALSSEGLAQAMAQAYQFRATGIEPSPAALPAGERVSVDSAVETWRRLGSEADKLKAYQIIRDELGKQKNIEPIGDLPKLIKDGIDGGVSDANQKEDVKPTKPKAG